MAKVSKILTAYEVWHGAHHDEMLDNETFNELVKAHDVDNVPWFRAHDGVTNDTMMNASTRGCGAVYRTQNFDEEFEMSNVPQQCDCRYNVGVDVTYQELNQISRTNNTSTYNFGTYKMNFYQVKITGRTCQAWLPFQGSDFIKYTTGAYVNGMNADFTINDCTFENAIGSLNGSTTLQLMNEDALKYYSILCIAEYNTLANVRATSNTTLTNYVNTVTVASELPAEFHKSHSTSKTKLAPTALTFFFMWVHDVNNECRMKCVCDDGNFLTQIKPTFNIAGKTFYQNDEITCDDTTRDAILNDEAFIAQAPSFTYLQRQYTYSSTSNVNNLYKMIVYKAS